MKLLAFLFQVLVLVGLSLLVVPGADAQANCNTVTRKPRNSTTYPITNAMLQLIQNLASG